MLWATKDLTLEANADSTDYCATVSGAVEMARLGPFTAVRQNGREADNRRGSAANLLNGVSPA